MIFCQVNNPVQCIHNDYGLTNVVYGPTCYKNQDEQILNEVILTNCQGRRASTLNINIGLSDHPNQVQAARKMYAPKSEKRIIHCRIYKTFNESHFLDELQQTPFQVAKIFDDPVNQFLFHTQQIMGK